MYCAVHRACRDKLKHGSFLVSFGPGAPHGGGTVAIKMESVLWVVCDWGLVLLVLVRQVGVLRGTVCWLLPSRAASYYCCIADVLCLYSPRIAMEQLSS